MQEEDPWSGGGEGEEGEDDMINDLEVLLGDVGTVGLGEEDDESDDPDLKDEELLKIDLHVSIIIINTRLVSFFVSSLT